VRAGVNHAAKGSMETGVRAESQNLFTGETRHTVSACMTFLTLDTNGKPTRIPSPIFETPDERRCNREVCDSFIFSDI